jgi:methylenetetrahydrofolate reductase (NADPH)
LRQAWHTISGGVPAKGSQQEHAADIAASIRFSISSLHGVPQAGQTGRVSFSDSMTLSFHPMSKLEDKIRAGQFVVTSELTPPKGIDLTDLFAKAEQLRASVDAFNLTESPRARMAVEPKCVGAALLARGIEPIVQITARDRNRIAIQADLLGGAVLGLGNFVFMTGDQPRGGDHPEAKPVFDWTASDMLRAARELSAGRDAAGNELKGAPHLFIGAVANPGAKDFDGEVLNTRRKIEAGANFLQTQALYEADALSRFMDAVKPAGTAILAGIIPLKSAKMARWLNDNVPGIRVPDALIAEMAAVAGTDREVETGIAIAARLIGQVRSLCAGVHVMGLGWEHHIPRILEVSGIRRQMP